MLLMNSVTISNTFLLLSIFYEPPPLVFAESEYPGEDDRSELEVQGQGHRG